MRKAFTLAEILITLGVLGVVAAVTLPTLLTNVQERVRKEQVRTVKYKLTLATDKMKSLGLIGKYGNDDDATEAFIEELKKHYKIAKVCKNDNLRACWPTDIINTYDGDISVSDLTTGSALKALAIGSKSTRTVGLITGDGIPMILAFSPNCMGLEPAKTYSWSQIDGKPETNATTNCISAIFDINGAKAPNRVGVDIRTLNSFVGAHKFEAVSITGDECARIKNKYGIQYCARSGSTGVEAKVYAKDYWAGAKKQCKDAGLDLPSMQTLANLAGARYGRSDIGPYTSIVKNDYTNSNYTTSTGDCKDFFRFSGTYRLTEGEVICTPAGDIPTDTKSALYDTTFLNDGDYWVNNEISETKALRRNLKTDNSMWTKYDRRYNTVPLCVGD